MKYYSDIPIVAIVKLIKFWNNAIKNKPQARSLTKDLDGTTHRCAIEIFHKECLKFGIYLNQAYRRNSDG